MPKQKSKHGQSTVDESAKERAFRKRKEQEKRRCEYQSCLLGVVYSFTPWQWSLLIGVPNSKHSTPITNTPPPSTVCFICAVSFIHYFHYLTSVSKIEVHVLNCRISFPICQPSLTNHDIRFFFQVNRRRKQNPKRRTVILTTPNRKSTTILKSHSSLIHPQEDTEQIPVRTKIRNLKEVT